MFRIGDFARMNHISVATLRYYDECGLLIPFQTDHLTGYRLYSAEQMVTLTHILALKEAGLSLAEIRSHFKRGYSQQEMLDLLTVKESEACTLIQSEQERLRRLRNWIIAIQREEHIQMIDVTIKQVEPMWVAGLRGTIQDFGQIGALWSQLNQTIDACGGKQIVPCMMLYHNNEDVGPWHIEVVEPVAKPFEPTGDVLVYELPAAARMACVVHKGPYESIGKVMGEMHEWFGKNGYTHGMPTREIYHKGDWMTDDPSEYITEIQFPIE